MVFTKNKNLKKAFALISSIVMTLMMIIPALGTIVPPVTAYAEETNQSQTKVTYDFRDGSVIPTDTDGKKDITSGALTVKVGNKNAYAYNGNQHGVEFKDGNSIEIAVQGPTRVTVGDCSYSKMTELTLTSADGSYAETQATKTGCYHNDGSAMVFTYTEDAATTLVINFTNSVYVPIIITEALKVTYDFRDGSVIPTDTDGKQDVTSGDLTVKVGNKNAYAYNGNQHGVEFKDGNSIEIAVQGPTKVTVGDCSYSKMTELTLASADGSYTETQAAKAGCYHNDGSAMVFKYTGEAATTLVINFTNSVYVPVIITEAILEEMPDDNGAKKDSVAMYNFADGSVVPATYDSANPLNGEIVSKDGFLTVKGNGDLYMHDTQHGLALYNGNTFSVKVAGDAIVTFNLCQYGADAEAVIKAASKKGAITSEDKQKLQGTKDDGLSSMSFKYEGVATTLTFTVSAVDKAEMYLHGINVANLPESTETPELVGNGKTDVWDFGAEQLDSEAYNNMLTVDIINGWYDSSVQPGSEGATIGSFSTDEFFFNPAGRTNNRIRTSNTAITRYDTRTDKVIDGVTLTGYLYSNNASPVVYAGIKLYENDILTLYTGSNGGASTIYCESPSGVIQQGQSDGDGKVLKFYAPEYGIYKIYSTNEKLVIYRALREHTQPVVLSGAVDISAAQGIENKEYQLLLTNKETGAQKAVDVADGKYSTYINEGFHYTLSLKDANGYVIKSETNIFQDKGAGNKELPVVIERVDLVTVTGELAGLTEEIINNLKLSFVNNDYVYVPEFTITGTAYTAQFERNVVYTIQADGINDYYLSDITTISSSEDAVKNITFTAKPVYKVAVKYDNLPEEAAANAVVRFANINEPGYTYTFAAGQEAALRDGQYTVTVTNIGNVSYSQKITSDVKIEGKDVEKTISFEKLNTWNFGLLNGNPGIETINEANYYSGLAINEFVMENKVYLLVNENGEVKVPVKAGDILTAEYCYCASFDINGEVQVASKSGSTSTFETTQYTAKEDGVVTIKGVAGTTEAGDAVNQTYFTAISVLSPVAYSEKVYVGADKEYKTINAALEAVAKMSRPNKERVEIVIDPGNYEEMLTINLDNVSLVNAAGDKASIELTNKGADITENAVRITSYYGHGYDYYSMGADCKYNEELLAANKENGYLSATNPGSGTTRGSYWNATVVVYAQGFEADGIIFENSFNQYISEKEANDIVVMWETGSKGERSTTAGDTSVQQKSYVERAAAMSIVGDKSVFKNCKFIGRQDTLYGGTDIKAVFEKCDILGGTDYIFGGMTAVFYQCALRMNTDSENNNDVAYITAAQQSGGRGYLMYNCNVTSTTPGVDTASAYRSKQGYFGRPWAANTSEVVFYMTNIETTDDTRTPGQSLIAPVGWSNSLGGSSSKMYEYGSRELSGEDNLASRVEWSTVLESPAIDEGKTDITIEAFLGDWTTELRERGFFAGEISEPHENGLTITEDGSILYYENGKVSTTYTGMAEDTKTGKKYWFDEGVAARSKEVCDQTTDLWYWCDEDGTIATNKDVNIPDGTKNGKWVRYDENGAMVKGEDYRYDGWYFFDVITGAMVKGFINIPDETEEGKWVYYDEITGQMHHGVSCINGNWYRFDDVTGKMVHGEYTNEEGIWYYDNITGIGLDLGWLENDGAKYWYEAGKRQGMEGRGKEIYDPVSDAWYWLDSIDNGKMAVSKDVYQESWAGQFADRDDGTGKWVRYDENGHMVKGWNEQNGSKYYFDYQTGAMAKGEATIDGTTYYFDMNTGICQ